MADLLTAKIDGLDAALKKLAALKDSIQKKALRAGVAKASRLAAKAAKAQAPKASGTLKKSIAQKITTTKKQGVVGKVGAKKGEGVMVTRPGRTAPSLARPTRYAHLVEKGTGASPARRGAPSRARPFLRPAWQVVKAQAEKIIIEEINAAIAKATGGG